MTQWKKLLKSLGFTESEVTVYLVSLEMGPASVQDLAKKANVSRVTTYTVIEALMRDGLMSTVQKGKKNYFVAEAPERLVSFVQNKVKGMESTLGEVSASLHELKLIQRGEKPVVKMYEGDEASRVIQEDIVKTQPQHIDEFGNYDDMRRHFPKEAHVEHGNRVAKFKPRSRSVYIAHETGDLVKHNPNLQSHRILDKKIDFHGDLVVYGDKVAMLSFADKPIGVIVESKNIAELFRTMFDHYWSLLPKEGDSSK